MPPALPKRPHRSQAAVARIRLFQARRPHLNPTGLAPRRVGPHLSFVQRQGARQRGHQEVRGKTDMHLKKSVKIGDTELTIETGHMAKQADGSVVVRYGDTMLLVTAVSAREKK
ncbi:MAG TPA: hypothetical protein VK458_15830, partial [Myxococcaceae bacterium]|nr:hypothetical protein [Myxococcaceae bacterium]